MRDIDILMLTNWDWANTGWRYRKALETMPVGRKLDIRMYKGKPHSFNYPEQAPIHSALFDKTYRIDNNGKPCTHPIIIPCPELRDLVERAKCIWFQAETFIDTGADLSDKHVVVTLSGATMRQEPEKVSRFFNRICAAYVAQFPTMMNLGAINDHLIYYPVDSNYILPDYKPRRPGKVTVGHFPSSPEAKGTDVINGVITKLEKEFPDRLAYIGNREINKRRTKHLDWQDNLKRMAEVDVLIETIQLEIMGKPFGEFGNTAFEGSALGKIVITNSLNTDYYQKEYGDLALWIANDGEQLENQLRRVLSMSDEDLLRERVKIRGWVEANHSIPATGQRLWEKIYKDVF